jgi:hypothetical protein
MINDKLMQRVLISLPFHAETPNMPALVELSLSREPDCVSQNAPLTRTVRLSPVLILCFFILCLSCLTTNHICPELFDKFCFRLLVEQVSELYEGSDPLRPGSGFRVGSGLQPARRDTDSNTESNRVVHTNSSELALASSTAGNSIAPRRSINAIDYVTDAVLYQARRCVNLRVLCLAGMHQWTSGALVDLLEMLPELLHLDLSRCPQVDDELVAAIVEVCGDRLRTLRVEGCGRIRFLHFQFSLFFQFFNWFFGFVAVMRCGVVH